MVGKVRTPLDEYRAKQKGAKAAREHSTSDRMPTVYSTNPVVMPTATQAGSTVGKPVKTNDSPDYIKRKVKGYSSEPM